MLPRALSAALSCIWMLPGRLLMLSVEAFPRHFATRGDVVSLSPSRRRPRRGGGRLLSFVATSARNEQRAPLDRLVSCRGGGGMGISDTNAPELAAVLDEVQSSEATMATTNQPTRTRRPPSTPTPLPSPAGVLEIEEKFDLTSTPDAVSRVERRLRNAGFVQHSVVEMVDWYFDVPTYNLCLHDCWLRYRHQVHQERSASSMPKEMDLQEGQDLSDASASSGGWQLKRGRKVIRDNREGGERSSSSRATVYEETEGIHAVALACSLLLDLPEPRDDASPLSLAAVDFDSTYPIPVIPPIPQSAKISSSSGDYSVCRNPPDLVPFARIVTRRSHWVYKDVEDDVVDDNVASLESARPSQRFAGLVVDLDSTDFGHAVGEVEALVNVSADGVKGEEPEGRAVAEARQLIGDFLRLVIHPNDDDGDDGDTPSVDVSTGTTSKRVPAQGKLECYLERFRPELYRALIQEGVMKRPPGIESS